MLQPLKDHRPVVYLMYSSIKFNKMGHCGAEPAAVLLKCMRVQTVALVDHVCDYYTSAWSVHSNECAMLVLVTVLLEGRRKVAKKSVGDLCVLRKRARVAQSM